MREYYIIQNIIFRKFNHVDFYWEQWIKLLLSRLHSRCLELKDWHPSEVGGYNNGRCPLV